MTDLAYANRIEPKYLRIISQFTENVPVKVGALATALGINVVVAPLPLNVSGLIQPNPDGSFQIKVNRFEPKERQRFTIAHEIAHFLLHQDRLGSGIVDSILYRSKLSSRLEAEANRLAADIIMPADKVRDAIAAERKKGNTRIVETLAATFSVSKQAMGIRTGD